MGPGRTSRAWYFHSPEQTTLGVEELTWYLSGDPLVTMMDSRRTSEEDGKSQTPQIQKVPKNWMTRLVT